MDRSSRDDEGSPPLDASSGAPGGSSMPQHARHHIHFSSQQETQPQHYQRDELQQHQHPSYYSGSSEDYGRQHPLHERGGSGSDTDSTPPPALSTTTPGSMTPTSSSAATSSTMGEHLLHGSHSPHRRGGPVLHSSSPPAPVPEAEAVAPATAAAAQGPGVSLLAPAPAIRGRSALSAQVESAAAASAMATAAAASAASASSLVSIKLLVSNNVAGSIIGRSGQTISELQARSSARIKLSQAGDCFPGTSDRVCLVQGSLGGVKSAAELILTKLHELQRPQQAQQHVPLGGNGGGVPAAAVPSPTGLHHVGSSQHLAPGEERRATDIQPGGVGGGGGSADASAGAGVEGRVPSPPSFSFVVRILVPTPSCGMLIGRGGSNVKSMAESSGVTSIRLSPKENEAVLAATSERVVTVTSPDLAGAVRCVGLILDGMGAHPDICRYANMTTSYSRATSVLSAAQQAAAAAAAIASSSMGGASFVQTALGATHGVVGAAGGVALAAAAAQHSSQSPGPTHQHQHQHQHQQHRSSLEAAAAAAAIGSRGGGVAVQSSALPHISSLSGAGGGTAGVLRQHQLLGLQPQQPSSSQHSATAHLRYAPIGRPADDDDRHHHHHHHRGDVAAVGRGGGGPLGLIPPPPPPSPVMVASSSPVVALPPTLSSFGQATHGHYLPAASLSSASPSQQHGGGQQQSIYVLAQPPSQGGGGRDRTEGGGSRRSSSAPSSTVGLPLLTTDQFAAMQLSGSGHGALDASLSRQPQPQQQQQQRQYLRQDPGGGGGGGAPSTSTSSAPSPQPPSHLSSSLGSSPGGMHGGPAASLASAAASVQIAVPDTLIGAILGRDGQTLKELQLSTGTRIKISQRGVFVPGTNHRVVTITGPSAESVATAQFMIGQRLAVRPRTEMR